MFKIKNFNIKAEKINFLSPNNGNLSHTKLFIYDLTNSEIRSRGFKRLKQKTEKFSVDKENLRVIIGGGDGTVMWVLQEMIDHKIRTELCSFGIVPFGTGNDFSRVLGWGGSFFKL